MSGRSEWSRLTGHWRSWLARLVDIEEVTGSSPVWPTSKPRLLPGFICARKNERLSSKGFGSTYGSNLSSGSPLILRGVG